MSGHSKWATIKRKKGAADAKRGQLFTKLIKELTISARMGGGDPAGNPRLRTAIEKARAGSMPGDNIERAIKKGTGELEGVHYEEVIYEGYAPAGVAVLIESVTDNKNRTVAELRNLLQKQGGHLGESGSVAWMFEKKGVITFDKKTSSEDQLMEVALDAGAEDIKDSETQWDVLCTQADFEKIKSALEKANLKALTAEITMVPKNVIQLGEAEAEKVLKFMEVLEEHDDVQKTYANFDIPQEILDRLNP